MQGMLKRDGDVKLYSPILHYPLVPSLKKINIGNTGNQNPPEGGTWLPVFPILIFVSRKPADNAKMVNGKLIDQLV